MLPENLHKEEIIRFHATVMFLNKQIDNEHDMNKKSELCMQYFQLVKLWRKIDNFIEFTVKHELDFLGIN